MKKGIMTTEQLYAKSETYNRLIEWKKKMFHENEEDPYTNLANAIICYAVDDYRMAIEQENEELIADLESFFKSDWCKLLSGVASNFLTKMILTENKTQRRQAAIG